MPEIVPATPGLVRMLTDKPLPRTVRAIAAVDGDQVLGITGFYAEDGRLVMFAGISDRARAEAGYKRTVIRCARKIMGMAAERRMPIYAEADADVPGSEILLDHLGFTPLHGRYYVKEQP